MGMKTTTRYRYPGLLCVAALAYARAHVVGVYVDGRAIGCRAPASAMNVCERIYDCKIKVCTELPRNTFIPCAHHCKLVAAGVMYIRNGAAGSPVRMRRQGS